VELVETDEEETRELTLKSRTKQKPAAKRAQAPKAPKEVPFDEAETYVLEKGLPLEEEETELDLSDLSLDMDVETSRPVKPAGDEEITESDLEDLLQETSDEEVSFDLSTDKERVQKGKDEEVMNADLESLFQEATAEEIEEVVEGREVPEVVSENEAVEEIQLEEEKPSLTDINLAVDSLEETQAVTELFGEEKALPRVLAAAEETVVHEEPGREEIATEEPSLEKLTGISEERMEEIITKVVEEVVERVARETMASVAERVLGQAIEALKASLETSAEES